MTETAPTQAPTSHAHYMRPLDGLRGLACLMVIALHIFQILNLKGEDDFADIGKMGVVIFFALSGFLMAALYSDEKFTFDSVGKYAIARAARIAPPYWVAILFAWVLYLIIPDFHYQMTPLMMARSMFFAGNQGVFWSIPPEIQFYGFFILLWYAWHRAWAGRYDWLVFCIVASTVLIATKEVWGGLMLPSKLHIFLAGFAAALLLKHRFVKPILCSLPFQILTTAAVILYAVFILGHDKIYEDFFIPCLVALMVASLSQSSILTKPFETDTMRLMGAASFSIYLFHDPILRVMEHYGAFAHGHTMASIAMMCIVSLALPVAFHFLGEKPLNKSAKSFLLARFEALKARRGWGFVQQRP